ncbi:MAG: GntR family transcriptional regulator, partial [Anaerolineae bacterium]
MRLSARLGGQLLELAPLNDQVYQVLRQRILAGELRAGARVDPQEISRDLGVSITPVKDALMRLS